MLFRSNAGPEHLLRLGISLTALMPIKPCLTPRVEKNLVPEGVELGKAILLANPCGDDAPPANVDGVLVR